MDSTTNASRNMGALQFGKRAVVCLTIWIWQLWVSKYYFSDFKKFKLWFTQIIDGRILCVHGGLSPDIKTLDQIRVLARVQEIPHEGAFCGMFYHNLYNILLLTLVCRFDVERPWRSRNMGSQSTRCGVALWGTRHAWGRISSFIPTALLMSTIFSSATQIRYL